MPVANQRELDVLERLETLERAVFGEERVLTTGPAPAKVQFTNAERVAQIRADAERVRKIKGMKTGPKPKPKKAKPAAEPKPELIDLNTATIEQLITLEGVGKARAERIIEQRPYSTPEDLLKLKGSKAAVLQKILDDNRDRLTVGKGD